MHYTHCNGYSQIFIENLLPNQRFGVETVNDFTVSTNYNHYSKNVPSNRRSGTKIAVEYAVKQAKIVINVANN